MANKEQAIGLTLENTSGRRYDTTDLLWPRYQRQSAAIGGDLTARSSFGTDINTANIWLDRLGWGFVESYAGVPTWIGKLAKITADLYGQVVSINLRDVYNSIIVVYYKTIGGSINETTAINDQASIDRFGFRQLVYTSPILLDDSGALEVRDGLLIKSAWPRVKAEQLRASGGGGVTVSLEFDGLIKTLQYQNYELTTGSTLSADQAVLLALASATEIDIGIIEVNTLSVSRRSGITDIWSRLKGIADLGDQAGNFWAIGAYSSNNLDYYKPDFEIVSYYAELDRDNRLVYFDAQNNMIPPALIKPVKIVWRRDLLAGRQIAYPLLNDHRAMVTGAIQFSRAGVQITGLSFDANATWQALINRLAVV